MNKENIDNNIIADDLTFILNSNIDWEKFRNKTVFMTGGYGMLLSYMAYSLLHLNEMDSHFNVKVILLIRSETKAKKRFQRFLKSRHLSLFEHDLTCPIEISDHVDFIIHGAGHASPHHFSDNPSSVLIPNVMGTFHVLEFSRKKNIEGLLVFSSGAVYGTPIAGDKVTESDYGYLDPLKAMSIYGECKRLSENMCACWHEKYALPVKIVRPAHIYGPTMNIDDDRRVVASFVNNILKGQNITIKSDGTAKRSFCYIADATIAFFKVLLEGNNGEAYNVGNDNEYMTIVKLAECFAMIFPEKEIQVIVEGSGGDQEKMLMLSNKVRALGWKCSFPLHAGLKRTIESYTTN